MKEFCNLGYANGCSRLPRDKEWDAVRFAVARQRGAEIVLSFVCESGHRPAVYGMLEYDTALGRWNSRHPDARIQRMAECYLDAFQVRRNQGSPTGFAASSNT